ncbi:hypothetical protein [Streptomyces abyssomicinicus]|uniref:hypothetical protein n=1 Tax=Streptomyces abyssomicinicus TaxID=574929 RepID=UPI0012502819|nr:hypothetical protein [Streptomyces abyssomicinicus]
METKTERVPERRDEGCLVVAVRIPVRVVALVVVLPLRMLWDLVAAAGRLAWASVLGPVWRGSVRAAAWLGRVLVLTPARALYRWVLAPLGRGLALTARGVWWLVRGTARGIAAVVGWLLRWLVAAPAVALYRWVLTPMGHALRWLGHRCLDGLRWLYRSVLAPLGRGARWLGRGVSWLGRMVWAGVRAVGVALGTAVAWLARWLLFVPAVALYRWVLTPLGHLTAWVVRGVVAGAAWLLRHLVVAPLTAVGRVLAVVLREVADALGHAWRIAGRISLAVGRGLATLLRWIFVEPVRWAWRAVFAPAGRLVRDVLLRPLGRAAREAGRALGNALVTARVTVREVRREVRTALFGSPREGLARPAVEDRREPTGPEARTLGSSTTALTKD